MCSSDLGMSPAAPAAFAALAAPAAGCAPSGAALATVGLSSGVPGPIAHSTKASPSRASSANPRRQDHQPCIRHPPYHPASKVQNPAPPQPTLCFPAHRARGGTADAADLKSAVGLHRRVGSNPTGPIASLALSNGAPSVAHGATTGSPLTHRIGQVPQLSWCPRKANHFVRKASHSAGFALARVSPAFFCQFPLDSLRRL